MKRDDQEGQEVGFGGIARRIERHYRRYRQRGEANSSMEAWLDKVMVEHTCPDCNGARVRADAAALHHRGQDDPRRRPAATSTSCTRSSAPSSRRAAAPTPAGRCSSEIRGRLELLLGIGLDYLNFNRRSGTLSGGESQRIRLSTQIGSGLMGMLYVLDEPSIGLHPKDNVKMIATLESLRDIGNTVIVVEHDEDTIRAADHIVEMGPGPGVHGGKVVVQGTLDDVLACKASPTGQFLSGKRSIATPAAAAQRQRQGARRPRRAREQPQGDRRHVPARHARRDHRRVGLGQEHADQRDPLQGAVEAAGRHAHAAGRARRASRASSTCTRSSTSTSRRSAATAARIRRPTSASTTPSATSSPRRRCRSSAATRPGRFSFNVKGGRCEECQGEGVITTQLYFMPDVEVTCGACKGARFNSETLEVTLRGKTIDDVLNMSVEEGVTFFASEPAIGKKIEVLNDLGLGYLTLGQSATTLSGGEAQRIKIATELSKLQRVEAHGVHPRRADDGPAPGGRRAAARCRSTGWWTRGTRCC